MAAAFAKYTKEQSKHGALARIAASVNLSPNTFKYRYDKNIVGQPRRGPEPRLGLTIEQKVKEWILLNETVNSSPTITAATRIVRQIAVEAGLKDTKIGGRDWWKRFFSRNPELTTRAPQLIERFRATATSSVNMKRYFDILKTVIADVPANKIYNVDESGISLRNMKEDVSRFDRAIQTRLCHHKLTLYIPPCR